MIVASFKSSAVSIVITKLLTKNVEKVFLTMNSLKDVHRWSTTISHNTTISLRNADYTWAWESTPDCFLKHRAKYDNPNSTNSMVVITETPTNNPKYPPTNPNASTSVIFCTSVTEIIFIFASFNQKSNCPLGQPTSSLNAPSWSVDVSLKATLLFGSLHFLAQSISISCFDEWLNICQ